MLELVVNHLHEKGSRVEFVDVHLALTNVVLLDLGEKIAVLKQVVQYLWR